MSTTPDAPVEPVGARGGPSFAALGLSPPLLSTIAALGHATPTAIQVAAIPVVLSGRDVWASAQTGSGKTAAFVLPLLEIFGVVDPPSRSAAHRRDANLVRALVLVPTRELAVQIHEAIISYGRGLGQPSMPKTVVAVGGLSINPQMMALRGGADVLVATPGRLLDLVEHNAVVLSDVELLVLDEADRLLQLGFADELTRVLGLLPRCQRLLFSATFPPAVSTLAARLLDEPVRIAIDAGTSLGDVTAVIEHRAIDVDGPRRTMLLRHLLDVHGWTRVLVFVASRYKADHVADKLKHARIAAAPLHGDLSQGARTQALADFKASRLRVLVATDVAARGIDVVALPAVVNYDLPRSPVDYLHRIGRTGRAGEHGIAVSFVTSETEAHFRLIAKRHRLHIARETIAGFERTAPSGTTADTSEASETATVTAVENSVAAPILDPNGGVKGKRKSKKDKLRAAR